jgi:tetratricopeptide (TPR) repeat protein
MRTATLALTGWLCWAACHAAEPKWIRLQSASFEMYTPGSERAARDAIRHLEMVQSFFSTVVHQKRTTSPIRVVFFQDEKLYHAYQPKSLAVAHFQHTPDRDLIAIGRYDPEKPDPLTHEYVHALVQHSGIDIPLWLNEGLAEYYSSMRPKGTKALVGSLHYERLESLRRDVWVGLDRVLKADEDSPYYNEAEKATAFYNESWALVHMLLQAPGYKDQYLKFLEALLATPDPDVAFQSAYGKTVKQVNRELRDYVESKTFSGSLLDYQLAKSAEQPEVGPAADFDVRLTLADLLPYPEKSAERKSRYEALAKDFPDRPEPAASLGLLLLQDGQPDQAGAWFDKAWQKGCKSPETLRRYAWLLRRSQDLGRAEEVLKRSLEIDGSQVDVRVDLAWVVLQTGNADRAYEFLRPIRSVTPRQSPDVFEVLAYVALRRNNLVEAKKAAQRFAETARTEEQKREARALEQAIQRKETSPVAEVNLPDVKEEVPTPVRKEPPGAELPKPVSPKPGVVVIEGYLLEVRCYGARPRVRIETSSGTYNLLFPPEDPIVRDAKGAAKELGCGTRERDRVRAEFELKPGGDPLVRVIDFR